MNIEVRVISLKDSPPLLTQAKRDFGENFVSSMPAIDMRRVSSDSLMKSGLVSLSAVHSMDEGRKWHKELTSPGTVGLHQSNRLIMHQNDGPVLILEEDCKYNKTLLEKEISKLLTLGDAFDVAVFGASYRDIKYIQAVSHWCQLVKGNFMMTHCVLYSRAGRKKMAHYLDQMQEVQIDFYIGALASRGLLTVYLHDNTELIAWQSGSATTLQLDTCILCYLPSHVGGITIILIAVILIILFIGKRMM